MSDNKNSLGMDQKTASWFAYVLSIVSAVILLGTEKNDRTIRLHAWQSLFLGCAIVAAHIIFLIFSSIGGYTFFRIIYNLLRLGWLVLTILCIIKATQNDIFKIPVIYNYAEKMK